MVSLDRIFLDNKEVGVETHTYHGRTIGGGALTERTPALR